MRQSIIVWNGQSHCCRGVDAGKSKFQHTRGKKRKKVKRDMSKKNQEEDGKSNSVKTSVKNWGAESLFSPPFVGRLPCNFVWSWFVEEALKSRHLEPPDDHQGYPMRFIMRCSCSALSPPLPIPPTLSLFWLNSITESCLITPACNDPPCPNNSLILIPLLPAALTSAQCRSVQGHGHIFPMKTLFIFCKGSPPWKDIPSQFSKYLEKRHLHYQWLFHFYSFGTSLSFVVMIGSINCTCYTFSLQAQFTLEHL